MSAKPLLNTVDEDGNIIGEDTRENIHKNGLLHREVHVWFYTPQGEIIFQHRGKNADTFPDLLDATIGGHVEIGEDFESTALQEIREETGLEITKNQLVFLRLVRDNNYDEVTKTTNNVLRTIYTVCFKGNINDLQLEKGKGVGFEAWSFDKIFEISQENKSNFIPAILKEPTTSIFKQIQTLYEQSR
ncbi:MAG: hydrolase of MutT (NUDIX) family protein [uncultured bacterium]|nr:MAG: hydrolase of MutT (NUDIX) family protein [uncultured bacterium]